MTTPFEQELIDVAVELLTEFGFSATVRHKGTPGSYNSSTLTVTEGNTTTACRACFFDPSNSKMTGYERNLDQDSSKGGKWMYVQCANPIKTGDVIEYGSGKMKVTRATRLGATNTAIVWKVASEEID